MRIKKILIAIDDTPSAMQAANYGIAFAKILNAKIGIIYVTEHSAGNIDAGTTPVEAEKALRRQHDTLIDEIEITHPGTYIKEFDPIGRPETEIENIIALWKPNLLVIGHHTHGFLENLIGHHTEKKLLRHLAIPLLIVPKAYKDE